jgi:hypothetical protein
MVVHDIEMHDIRSGIEYVGHFLTKPGEIRRQDGWCNLEIRHAAVLAENSCCTGKKSKRALYLNGTVFSATGSIREIRQNQLFDLYDDNYSMRDKNQPRRDVTRSARHRGMHQTGPFGSRLFPSNTVAYIRPRDSTRPACHVDWNAS